MQSQIGLLLVVISLILVHHAFLYHRLRKAVDYLFYGGWYDYPSVVSNITYTLERAGDIEALAETLCRTIQRSMQVKWSSLLLPGWETNSTVQATAGQGDHPNDLLNVNLRDLTAISTYLSAHIQPTSSQEILAHSEGPAPGTVETRLLNSNQVRLWVPHCRVISFSSAF